MRRTLETPSKLLLFFKARTALNSLQPPITGSRLVFFPARSTSRSATPIPSTFRNSPASANPPCEPPRNSCAPSTPSEQVTPPTSAFGGRNLRLRWLGRYPAAKSPIPLPPLCSSWPTPRPPPPRTRLSRSRAARASPSSPCLSPATSFKAPRRSRWKSKSDTATRFFLCRARLLRVRCYEHRLGSQWLQRLPQGPFIRSLPARRRNSSARPFSSLPNGIEPACCLEPRGCFGWYRLCGHRPHGQNLPPLRARPILARLERRTTRDLRRLCQRSRRALRRRLPEWRPLPHREWTGPRDLALTRKVHLGHSAIS